MCTRKCICICIAFIRLDIFAQCLGEHTFDDYVYQMMCIRKHTSGDVSVRVICLSAGRIACVCVEERIRPRLPSVVFHDIGVCTR